MSLHRSLVIWMIFLFCIAYVSFSVAQENLPAIVKKIEPSILDIFTYDKEGKTLRQGSGFFISKEGDVITGRDILKGADHADVRTADGMLYSVKKVLAEDKEANLIRVSVEIPLNLVHVPPISVALPQIGERMVAIAGPSNIGEKVSYGIVSAILELPAFGKILRAIVRLSPSYDGSPIVNMKGEVIGVIILVKRQFFNVLPIERAVGLTPGKAMALSKWEAEREETAEELYSEGLPYLWKEDYKKALRFFKEALKKDPRYANAYFQVGYCNAQLKHYQEALDAYRQAIRIKPDFLIAHFFLGLIYLEVRDRNHALEEYKILKDLDPGYAKDLFNMIY
jgi:tetratricopeptide (TPR) repeat protein